MSYTKRFLELHKQGKIDDTTIVKMSEFKTEMEKFAGIFSSIGQTIKKSPALQTGLIFTGLGIGQAVAGELVDFGIDRFNQYQTSREAENVFEQVYNESMELQKRDKETVRKYYSSLFHFSPKTALDPIATKSYLLSTVDWESQDKAGVPLNMIQAIADIEKKTQTGDYGITSKEKYLSGLKINMPNFEDKNKK